MSGPSPLPAAFDREALEAFLPSELDFAFRRRLRWLLEALATGPSLRLLDLGCGPGVLLRALAASAPRVRAVGLDEGIERLRQARAAPTPFPLLRGDAQRLPFRDSSFERVLAAEVLEHLPDDAAALREIRRVLVPGGASRRLGAARRLPVPLGPDQPRLDAPRGRAVPNGSVRRGLDGTREALQAGGARASRRVGGARGRAGGGGDAPRDPVRAPPPRRRRPGSRRARAPSGRAPSPPRPSPVVPGPRARLLGLLPGLAYNIAVPTFFALAGTAAFALGAALVRSAAARGEERRAGAPLLAGLFSASSLVLLGNLGQLRLLLLACALALADAFPATGLGRGALFAIVALVLGPLALSALLFRPFDASDVAPYTSVARNAGAAMPLAAWLGLWGLPAFLAVSLVALEVARRHAASEGGAGRRAWLAAAGLLVLALGFGLASGIPSEIVVLPLASAAAALALAPGGGAAPERRAVLLLGAGALLVTLGVDVLSVGGDRMNSVFKLSFQAWALLAVASGPALAWVVVALRDGERTRPGSWPVTAALLLGASALYPLTATPARFAERFPRVTPGEACRPFEGAPAPPDALGSGAAGRPRGLDGSAFLADSALCVEGRLVPLRYDGAGFAWLRANERGSPAILEAVLPEYRWGSRFSVHTGLPAVVGWSWHVRQHLAAVPGTVVGKRIAEVEAFYRSRLAAPGEGPGEGRTTVADVRRLLSRHRVRWVVDGLLERAVYGEEGLAKLSELERLGLLERAYANPGLTLWRVLPVAAAR